MISLKNDNIAFFQSAVSKKSHTSLDAFFAWLQQRRDAVKVEVNMVPFHKLDKWKFEDKTGNLVHESGRFFSIEGIEVKTNWGLVQQWEQPIINQPEIGFLGIIAKDIDGVLHFLMQCKIEPGNINYVQLSPTLQATKSNYTKVHKGNTPLYLEYFNGEKPARVILDQLQSEQGARFLKKRNRNIIVEIDEEIPAHPDFCWLTLGQIKELMTYDNVVNMDSRTVISGINYGTYTQSGVDLVQKLVYDSANNVPGSAMLTSALVNERSLHSTEALISWITSLKSRYDLEVNKIPLCQVRGWVRNEDRIHHEKNKYFSVIAADIHIGNREVLNWSQPLVESAQEGLIAFLVKKINGIYHFLVQAKIEAGNFDILELAPTVQCLTGNYRKGMNEYEVPFINEVLNAPAAKILYKSMQSEEGGRFYREQNLNMIVDAGDDFPVNVPENFCWMTLNQLFTFIQFNNYLNIQSRSLISAIRF